MGSSQELFLLSRAALSSPPTAYLGPSAVQAGTVLPQLTTSGVIFTFKSIQHGLERSDCNCGTTRWCANAN